MSYATSITAALRTAVSASRVAPPRAPGKGGKSRKRSKTQTLNEASAPISAPVPSSQTKQSDWGLFDPLRSLLGPVADILESLFTPHILIPLLATLLIYSWFFRSASTSVGPNNWSSAQRQVAYDELWRHEESELWTWLEERVALDRVHGSVVGARAQNEQQSKHQVPVRVDMKDREVDEAIRVTEERLKVLKDRVGRERAKSRTKSPKEEQT